MDLKVEPIQTNEIDAFNALFWAAFEPPEADLILPMVYPKGYQEDLKQRMHARMSARKDEGVGIFCAKNPQTGEIVGVSQWSYDIKPPQSQEELEVEYQTASAKKNSYPPVEGMNHALDDAFWRANLFAIAEAADGKPYAELQILATSPQHQRTGAGSRLISEGLRKADELGLPTLLVASRGGKPLYERFGFEMIKPFPFDCRVYGGRSEGLHWIMRRPAKS